MQLSEQLKRELFYGGLSREEYDQVKKPVSEHNRKALVTWSLVAAAFWIYCLLMSFKAEAYAQCRPAYTAGLIISAVTFVCAAGPAAQTNVTAQLISPAVSAGRHWA